MIELDKDQKISGCILVKNEEEQVREALLDLLSICDEVVVTDHGSTDSTIQIVKEMGVRIAFCPKEYTFSKARNFSLAQGKYDWKFFIDADERLGKKLKKGLRKIDKEKGSIYRIHRIDDIVPNTAGTLGNKGIIRLFRFNDFKYDEKNGYMQSPLFSKNIKVIDTDFRIIHCQRKNFILRDPTQILKRVVMDIELVKRDGSFLKYLILSMISFIKQFFLKFIFKGGYKDGKNGLKWSFLRALFHSLRLLFIGMKISENEFKKLISIERTQDLIDKN